MHSYARVCVFTDTISQNVCEDTDIGKSPEAETARGKSFTHAGSRGGEPRRRKNYNTTAKRSLKKPFKT